MFWTPSELKKWLPDYIKVYNWGLYCKKYDVRYAVDMLDVMDDLNTYNELKCKAWELSYEVDKLINLQVQGKLYPDVRKQ